MAAAIAVLPDPIDDLGGTRDIYRVWKYGNGSFVISLSLLRLKTIAHHAGHRLQRRQRTHTPLGSNVAMLSALKHIILTLITNS